MQFYDWMKDTTPPEEEEMRAHDWDMEETKFGPITERYRQPSLINSPQEHAKLLREAQDISDRVDAINAGERVRPLPSLLFFAIRLANLHALFSLAF